jgi:hypothetical protein
MIMGALVFGPDGLSNYRPFTSRSYDKFGNRGCAGPCSTFTEKAFEQEAKVRRMTKPTKPKEELRSLILSAIAERLPDLRGSMLFSVFFIEARI